MEATFVRGFSNTFMPDKKMEVKDLQYIEDEALEMTWKHARRQRLKQQEQKIWDEFVKEQDMVHSAVKEDPYQFLEQIPETQLKQMMDCELIRMKMETAEEQKRGAGDSPRREGQHTVTFSELQSEDDYHIFDGDREDGEDDLSIIEDDALNETLESPSTVRERDNLTPREDIQIFEAAPVRSTTDHSLPANETKSSENVANIIEGSIYCAKVKDTRMKMAEELLAMIASLEGQNLTCAERWALRKLCMRASEYSSRFQRIYLYQLQRQLNDIQRHAMTALPFAKHTHFQSQMLRIVNLHSNTLQALHVFHKSFEQTACLRECSEQLRALCTVLRETVEVCKACNMYTDLPAAKELYNDNILDICDKVESTLTEYTTRVNEFISATEDHSSKMPYKPTKGKKKHIGMLTHRASKTSRSDTANLRLSMYSLETHRSNTKSKVSVKDNPPDKVKAVTSTQTDSGRKKEKHQPATPKSHRKTPRSGRRPLMRDPQLGQPRRLRAQEADIQTMVENVEAASSNLSPDSMHEYPRRPQNNTPYRRAARPPAAKKTYVTANTHSSPTRSKAAKLKVPKALSPYILKLGHCSPRSETETFLANEPMTPVSKVQCAKKEHKTEPNTARAEELKIDLGNARFDDINCEPTFRGNALRNGRDTLRNGRDTSRNGRDTLRTGRESTRSGRESTRSGRESAKSGREFARRDHNSAVSGDELEISGDEIKTQVEMRATSRSRRAAASSRSDKNDKSGCEVTQLLRQLCGGDSKAKAERRVASARNAQLLFMNANSPRQPTTPQLLKILEETIQKKIPKHHEKKSKPKDIDKLRLAFNIPPQMADNLFKYRTKYVQHMLASSLYANSAVGKPWEMIGTISERIIDEILQKCAEELQLDPILTELYQSETQ